METRPFLIEACVETLEQAIIAERDGADQLELCSRLDLDGLTPSPELILQVVQAVSIPVRVMIRHRPGDFDYDESEVKAIIDDVLVVCKHNIDGVVFGAVLDRKLNLELIGKIASAARLPITVHKAIDSVDDPVNEIRRLKSVEGVTHVLTSGGSATAMDGTDVIREMVKVAASDLSIIAAGKITPANRDEVYDLTSAPVLHGKKIAGWYSDQHR